MFHKYLLHVPQISVAHSTNVCHVALISLYVPLISATCSNNMSHVPLTPFIEPKYLKEPHYVITFPYMSKF